MLDEFSQQKGNLRQTDYNDKTLEMYVSLIYLLLTYLIAAAVVIIISNVL